MEKKKTQKVKGRRQSRSSGNKQHHMTLIENSCILVMSFRTLPGMQHRHSLLLEIGAATFYLNYLFPELRDCLLPLTLRVFFFSILLLPTLNPT
ncbi:hypothetical protein VNO80_17481 [Phaseolus coccineus]|uniref:Uncharacterized protein n=1 Tax=Phaseolus coccineus TaxID=3886 RepID=A0AAN9MC16_PHACN